jgi:hypothetical protein
MNAAYKITCMLVKLSYLLSATILFYIVLGVLRSLRSMNSFKFVVFSFCKDRKEELLILIALLNSGLEK